MIGTRGVLAVVFIAFAFAVHSLKFCINCHLLPGEELAVSKCSDYSKPYEFKESSPSAGFLSPLTHHTNDIEDVNGDVNCWAACRLGLGHNCSEPGRKVCPSVSCPPVNPTVTCEDLAGGYTVSANCEESGTSCCAEPQEFTGGCSYEKVWRSRIVCFAVLETLMGVMFLLMSLRDKTPHERMPPFFMEDKKWVLQATSRS